MTATRINHDYLEKYRIITPQNQLKSSNPYVVGAITNWVNRKRPGLIGKVRAQKRFGTGLANKTSQDLLRSTDLVEHLLKVREYTHGQCRVIVAQVNAHAIESHEKLVADATQWLQAMGAAEVARFDHVFHQKIPLDDQNLCNRNPSRC